MNYYSYYVNLGKKKVILEVYLELQRRCMLALVNISGNSGCDRALEL